MSSAFGGQQSGSIFGGASLAPSQPAQTGGLFGSTPSSQPAAPGTGGGLFDRVTPATQSTSQPDTTAGTGGSLFDRTTPATQSQQSSSLFSNLGDQSKPASSGSIFDTSKPQNTTSSAPTSNLFSSLSSAPQQTSGLFGTINPPASSHPAGLSIFAPQQPQAQNQNQSEQQAQNGAPAHRAPGYFDNLIEKGKRRARDGEQGPGFQNLPNLQLGLGDISKRVRELGGAGSRGRKEPDSRAHYLLAASGVNIGTTRRDLDSLGVSETFTNRAPFTVTPEFDPDNRKYYEQLEQRLTTRMVQEGLERARRQFDEYLEENVDINWEQQRKKIYEHFGLTPRNAETDELSGSVKGSFGQSARRSRLGRTQTSSRQNLSRSIFGQSSLQKSVIGTPGIGSGNATLFADVAKKGGGNATGSEDRSLRDKQRKYAERVQALNEARLRKTRTVSMKRPKGSVYPILKEFLSIDNDPSGDLPTQIAAAYKALIEIVKGEDVPERAFAQDYLDEMPNSARSMKVRKQIIDGSRKSLEKEFFGQLEEIVSKNPREANIGGIPTALSKVRAYVRIRAVRKDLAPDGAFMATMGEDYCWALIFYLLRSGMVDEAADYVVGNAPHFKTIDRNIITFLTSYAKSPDRRLDGRVQRDCNNVYSAMTKTAPGDSIDPYRVACYKIIGRCELSRRILDHINQSVDDWIWLQFNLAREANRAEESAADVYGLSEVRETIAEIGQRHFDQGHDGFGGFGTFFHLQILGGMFEQAVAYVYSYSYTTAVHFAIALDYYGLLRVSDFSVSETELRKCRARGCIDPANDSLVTYNTKSLPQLNFGRMIGYYTRDFRTSNAEAAVDYLALLCLNADLPGQLGKSQAGLCHEALRELVLETREFALLLGDIRYDGIRLKGAIEERLEIIALEDQEDFLKTVTVQAASVADDNGRVTDAVLLFHLAEDFENVIATANRALSESLSIDIGAEPMRLQPLKPRMQAAKSQSEGSQPSAGSSLSLTSVDDPYTLASNMVSLYTNNTMYFAKIKPKSRETSGILLRLSEARASILAGQWVEAYNLIAGLHLLPLAANGNIPIIRNSAQAFNNLPSPISRNVGPILLWTITCISQQRHALAQRQFEAGENKQISDNLLSAAKDLMVFAGMLKYRLGEKVWEAVCNVGGDAGAY
ncbi:uncharacterized protein KY384_005550 [Bacidia gigantensis]|uniref:uncharacterized protein n=1 Tax=Bacidia gigantensis TaxID=2732470 RepID=UPI001D04C0EC|nr:uncharacterized protein KY384_005550 [Bacidia gigantensis]KAG8530068.1 hypothetical protein KY384_005550 [Bacidia gigantensis]